MTATAEQIAMAERIVRAHYPEMRAGYRGRRFQIALAAIIETTERAAKLADKWLASDYDESANTMASNISNDLRDGLHLKGTINDQG